MGRPNIFFMFYEDIVKDIGKAAQRIAAFMGRELDEAGVKQVVERCDREYMAKDKKFKCTLENKALGFGENSWKAKPLDQKALVSRCLNLLRRKKNRLSSVLGKNLELILMKN